MTKTARTKVLEFLEKKGVASVQEVSRVLKMTPANARHHLGLLASDGRAQVIGKVPAEGRGRPASLYAAASRSARHNLERLSDALLCESLQNIPADATQAYLARLAARLLADHDVPAGNLGQRLTHAVRHLEALGYDARWEARAEAPRLILGHCPYAAILPGHPELCQMDTYLLEQASGLGATQTARLERTPQGLTQCVFRLGK